MARLQMAIAFQRGLNFQFAQLLCHRQFRRPCDPSNQFSSCLCRGRMCMAKLLKAIASRLSFLNLFKRQLYHHLFRRLYGQCIQFASYPYHVSKCKAILFERALCHHLCHHPYDPNIWFSSCLYRVHKCMAMLHLAKLHLAEPTY